MSLILLIVLHSPVHIMANPHRGGRGGSMNGRGGGTLVLRRDTEPASNQQTNSTQESRGSSENAPNYRSSGGSRDSNSRGSATRGGVLGGRGGFAGGRGVNPPPRGGFRGGRGRGQGALWSSP